MEWINIITATELVRLQTDHIVFIMADGNYSDVYLVNGKKRTMTFKLKFFDDFFQRLKSNTFVRVGKSMIVNKQYIYIINPSEQEIILSRPELSKEFLLKASKEALRELKSQMEAESRIDLRNNVVATGQDREKGMKKNDE